LAQLRHTSFAHCTARCWFADRTDSAVASLGD
jgi:hypothetical protein